jgi:hypothetical protein
VVRTRATSPAYLGYHPFREATRSTVAIERVAEALLVEEETQRIMPARAAAGAAVTDARVHFRVNAAASLARAVPARGDGAAAGAPR